MMATFVFMSGIGFAAAQNLSTNGTYIAGSSESLDSAKQHALKEAMRQATEQAGVLVSSYTKTHNMILTDDEVTTVAAKIIRIENKKFDVKLISDSEIQVTAHIDVIINTDNINMDIEKLRRENQELKELNDDLKNHYQLLSNLNNIEQEIEKEYKIYGGSFSAKERPITKQSTWQDALYNFNLCMAHKDYYGAGGYSNLMGELYMQTLGMHNINKHMDKTRAFIKLKQIERFIAAKRYVWGWRFSKNTLRHLQEYHVIDVDSNVKNKIEMYYKILDEYVKTNRPDIYKKEK